MTDFVDSQKLAVVQGNAKMMNTKVHEARPQGQGRKAKSRGTRCQEQKKSKETTDGPQEGEKASSREQQKRRKRKRNNGKHGKKKKG